MAKTYTSEELHKCDKKTLSAIILSMQDQIETLNRNMEKLIEQIAAANNHRYGKKSEKMDVIDGQLNLFNEPEMLIECQSTVSVRNSSGMTYTCPNRSWQTG